MAVENARRDVADLIAADPREIVWTSGATEADNLAIKGVAAGEPCHIVTSAIEHKAVLDTCAHLEAAGCRLTYLSPDREGRIDAEAVAAALEPDTRLVSIMHANNEIGTVNDIAAIAAETRRAGVLLHVDAAQSAGKLAIDVDALGVDLMSLSAHKMYGPKGVGALYVRRRPRVPLRAQMHGGGHERGMRAGTLATHQVVGMGTAARLAAAEMESESERLRRQRERLWAALQRVGSVHLNGAVEARLAGALNVSVEGVEGELLLNALNDLALSTGSACTSASLEPSHVLRGIGVPDALAHSSLRISLGRFTTDEEVEYAASRLCEVIDGLRRSVAGESA
jgi:cysteine desulfurase